jgi:1-acyl-sn-glycerol-3-phosphate acyltransferase
MKRLYLIVRSAFLWFISWIQFVFIVPLLMILTLFINPRKTDFLQRLFARNIVRFAGVKLLVRRAPGFDPRRTSIFICNHVNLFDPYILYSAIPQFIRGWEMESHFAIPLYGWMMKRFGNISVPDQRTPGNLKKLFRETKQALEQGISLIVFPEGRRTNDGHLKDFQKGIFRLIRDFDAPIVPVSMVGSFEFNNKTTNLLLPATIVVRIHDTIETSHLSRKERSNLSAVIFRKIAEPIEAHYQQADTPSSIQAAISPVQNED